MIDSDNKFLFYYCSAAIPITCSSLYYYDKKGIIGEDELLYVLHVTALSSLAAAVIWKSFSMDMAENLTSFFILGASSLASYIFTNILLNQQKKL